MNINMAGTNPGGQRPAPAASLSAGEMFADRYEIIGELGAGGMGVVYKARDQVTREELVLKLIHPGLVDEKARERMIAEGVNTRKIRNEHVVAVHDVGEHQGQVFLSMEYVEGRPLRHWIAENMAGASEAPLGHVMLITQEILAGLAAAHAKGVIHRDLKPENVMVKGAPGDEDFAVKILDFGIATGMKTEVFTGSSQMLGTPLYMAPEQKTTPDLVGPEADIYSMGVMIYEMLMDAVPAGVWNPPHELRTDIPEALSTVLRKAMQPRRHRFQNVAEFAQALNDAVQDTSAKDVARVSWSSEGSKDLRSSLLEIDRGIESILPTDMRERYGLMKRMFSGDFSDFTAGGGGTAGGRGDGGEARQKPDAKPTPEPQKPESDGTKGALQDPKKRSMLIGALVVGVVIIAALSEDWSGGGAPPEPNFGPSNGPRVDPNVGPRVDPSPPPEPIRPAGGDPLRLTGYWRTDSGSRLQVEVNNDYVQGEGNLVTIGLVYVEGPIGAISVMNAMTDERIGLMTGGLQPRSGGLPGYDWVGMGMDLRSGQQGSVLFHINH